VHPHHHENATKTEATFNEASKEKLVNAENNFKFNQSDL
jgi:hypothetical protein